MSDNNHKEHSLEINKIAASILLAGVIAMVCGFIADGLYTPKDAEKRGYSVEVVEETTGGAGAAVEIDVGTLLASADAAKGGDIANKKCTSCHTFEQGGPNKVGPNLHGMIGANFAHKGDFAYSEAMKTHGGKWTYEDMNHWLKNPAKFIKGNKMAYAGIKNDQERADVIAYLASITPGAAAFPAPKPAEVADPAKAGTETQPTDVPAASGKGDAKEVQKEQAAPAKTEAAKH